MNLNRYVNSSIGPLVGNLKSDAKAINNIIYALFWRSEKGVDFLHFPVRTQREPL